MIPCGAAGLLDRFGPVAVLDGGEHLVKAQQSGDPELVAGVKQGRLDLGVLMQVRGPSSRQFLFLPGQRVAQQQGAGLGVNPSAQVRSVADGQEPSGVLVGVGPKALLLLQGLDELVNSGRRSGGGGVQQGGRNEGSDGSDQEMSGLDGHLIRSVFGV